MHCSTWHGFIYIERELSKKLQPPLPLPPSPSPSRVELARKSLFSARNCLRRDLTADASLKINLPSIDFHTFFLCFPPLLFVFFSYFILFRSSLSPQSLFSWIKRQHESLDKMGLFAFILICFPSFFLPFIGLLFPFKCENFNTIILFLISIFFISELLFVIVLI